MGKTAQSIIPAQAVIPAQAGNQRIRYRLGVDPCLPGDDNPPDVDPRLLGDDSPFFNRLTGIWPATGGRVARMQDKQKTGTNRRSSDFCQHVVPAILTHFAENGGLTRTACFWTDN